MRKSGRVRVHHEKERWGKALPWERAMGLEFTIRKSDGVRVHNEKKSDGVREKERWGESSP